MCAMDFTGATDLIVGMILLLNTLFHTKHAVNAPWIAIFITILRISAVARFLILEGPTLPLNLQIQNCSVRLPQAQKLFWNRQKGIFEPTEVNIVGAMARWATLWLRHCSRFIYMYLSSVSNYMYIYSMLYPVWIPESSVSVCQCHNFKIKRQIKYSIYI